jgi:hypothetical protein
VLVFNDSFANGSRSFTAEREREREEETEYDITPWSRVFLRS